MKVSIVGMTFADAEAFVAAMKVGADLTLVREPNNKFDKNAVAVWSGGQKIGYLPKTRNREIAEFVDRYGRALDAKFARSPNSGYPMAEINMETLNVESPSATGLAGSGAAAEGQPEAEGQSGSEESGARKAES